MIRLDDKNSGITQKQIFAYSKKIDSIISSFQKKQHNSPLAFLDLPFDKEVVQALQEFTNDQKKSFSHVLVLGIGGSSLGGMALLQSLRATPSSKMHVGFLSNIDPDEITETVKTFPLKKTLIVVISKSGETTETLSAFFHILEKIQRLNPKNWHKQVVIITDPIKGFLHDFANEHHVAQFHIPEFVGGRYSILSPVGMLPAALQGLNINTIVEGAKMMKKTWTSPLSKNFIAQLAVTLYLADTKLRKKTHVMFPYSSHLSYFADWYIQLFAESIGKTSKIGPQPIKAIGSIDQHSQIQLFMEGPNERFFTFLKVKKFQNTIDIPAQYAKHTQTQFLKNHTINEVIDAEQRATQAALTKQKRPNITLEIDTLDEEHVGMLFYSFEIATAMIAELYGINAFNQPGVELGKKLTKQYLKK